MNFHSAPPTHKFSLMGHMMRIWQAFCRYNFKDETGRAITARDDEGNKVSLQMFPSLQLLILLTAFTLIFWSFEKI
jgi:hypothetical protein